MTWKKMKKNLILKSFLISGVLIGLVGGFLLPHFVLAESCPSKTTVSGTTVIFVGELTDLGGDGTTSVWFQYGQTTSYGQKTSEKVLTEPGFYCITVSGLLPSTTYHYRAAARNTAGTTYGEDKSFTTTSGPSPTVDIEANGSDGPITISRYSSATLTWDSNNADSCYASGAWSGNKALSGSQSTGSLSSSRTYTLTCTGPGGSVSDSVTVNVDHYYDYPTVNIKANGSNGPISIPRNSSATLSWNSSDADSCYASGAWSGNKALSGSQSTGSLTSSRTYTLTCTGPEGSVSDSVTVNVDHYYDYPTVDIRANGSNGPITISRNSSATLTWNSSNADSCYASGAWSGNKALSGSQSTGSLTSSRTYTLTCTGPEGSVSDSVRVNVGTEVSPEFTIRKTVRNLSRGTVFSDSVYAQPGEMLTFGIVVQAGDDVLYDVIVKDTLPSGLIYRGDLRVDNVLTSGNIFTGLNIGNLSAGQEKTITFRADVAGAGSFSFGQTELTNTVLVSSGNTSRWDDAKVSVSRSAVAGIATQVPTGLTNNFFFDSFFLPLLITLLIIWLLKSRILKLEEWLDARKKQYQVYRSDKMLRLRIAQAKAKELFQQKM
jgi:uncharacterized repeat protein (TIGR01451 family)